MKERSGTELVGMRNGKGEMVYDAGGILDTLSDSFKELFGGKAIEQQNYDIEHGTLEKPVERICTSEVTDIITNLRNGKAVSVDVINAEMP